MSKTSVVSQTGPAHKRWRLTLPITALVLVSAVSNLLMLAGPLFMLQIYDRVLTSRSVPTLAVLTGLMVVLYAYYAFLEYLRSRMSTRAANLLDVSISDRLFAASVQYRLIPGALSNIDPVREGDILRAFVSGPGPLALLDLPWMPVYLAIIFIIHPMLGWVAIAGAIAIILLVVANEILSQGPVRKSAYLQSARQRNVESARTNAESIIGMGMLADIRRGQQRINETLLGAQQAATDRTTFFSAVIRALRFLLQSLVLAVGAYLVIQGQMTGGLMIAASVITSRALAPIDQIVAQWRSFVAARQAYGRIRKVFEGAAADTPDTRLALPKKTLTVSQLATAPQGLRAPIISGVDFQLRRGWTGVLGAPVREIFAGARHCRCVAQPGGSTRFDGALLDHYGHNQTGQIIGYLPQRIELFEGTIAANICRFPRMRHRKTIAAARAAGIHDMINNLPQGYDTSVGEYGELLSAGQRQLIGLARALYGDPFVVVLDEPNANLDTEGDMALGNAVTSVRDRGGIVIVIAHRPSAIGAVDKILLLENGRQVNFGPKSEVFRQAPPARRDNVHTIKASHHDRYPARRAPPQRSFQPQSARTSGSGRGRGLAGGSLWASQAEIAGAVAAPGTIMVDSFAKKIQHQEGGTVKAIHVRDGDIVTEGEDLVELDDTAIAANLAVLHTQIRERKFARHVSMPNSAIPTNSRCRRIDLPASIPKSCGWFPWRSRCFAPVGPPRPARGRS